MKTKSRIPWHQWILAGNARRLLGTSMPQYRKIVGQKGGCTGGPDGPAREIAPDLYIFARVRVRNAQYLL